MSGGDVAVNVPAPAEESPTNLRSSPSPLPSPAPDTPALRYRGGMTVALASFSEQQPHTIVRSRHDETVRGASIAAVGCSLLLASFLLLTATSIGTNGVVSPPVGEQGRLHEIHLQPQPRHMHNKAVDIAPTASQLETMMREEHVGAPAAAPPPLQAPACRPPV